MNFQTAENLTSFLVKETGSVFGFWSGRLTAKQQKELFGMNLGRGIIQISGEKECVLHVVKNSFGNDSDWNKKLSFGGELVTR